ncbi:MULTISPECIES: Cof-type HAD-IIB family hydrolase [Lactobacillus]|uniref:HAD family hydrolase n=1 Tax=Lactobacillus xujianguonis TaxID=2495899 RepID=A0A437SSZ6_9LACO|nr:MULTISPECIES: Cof-type HAD-IIB family hydrolase [Lactobacillus]RVU70076.1 HAD family hydrolase [Lactobacillus xujianguonis]RVU77655.1 HAD family hydrolase [Lactobacillus xujianguonis]
MTLPFKAVAVDMDGTFLDDRKQYNHEQFEQILIEFEKRGVHFIVASGRPYARLKQDFKGFADRMDFVSLNGSRLIIEGKQAAGYPLKRESVLDLIKDVQSKYGKIATMVYETHIAYLNTEVPKADREFLAYFAGRSAEVDAWDELPKDDIYEITFSLNSEHVHEVEEDFNKKHDDQIAAFASAGMAIDINAAGVNKGSGLKHLLEKMGLTGDDLIAFGDGGNDIDMLKFAKYSYAMANGMEEVKKQAKFIAPANTENGVFKTLQKYLDEDK